MRCPFNKSLFYGGKITTRFLTFMFKCQIKLAAFYAILNATFSDDNVFVSLMLSYNDQVMNNYRYIYIYILQAFPPPFPLSNYVLKKQYNKLILKFLF